MPFRPLRDHDHNLDWEYIILIAILFALVVAGGYMVLESIFTITRL